ncbi:MAG: VWA domain-containing protein [Nakamurella sp.]
MPNESTLDSPIAVPSADALGATTPTATAVQPADAGPVEPAPAEPSDDDANDATPPTETDPSAEAPVRLGAAAPVAKGLSYAVDIVFCIDVTGSMTPILDAVKANALRFYDDVQANLTDKGKNVDELRVRIIAFRDFAADPESALQESSFFLLPDERTIFSAFVDGLVPEGGGDAPESGLEAVALAINSPWTSRGDRRRQVIVVWTDQPAHPLNFAVLPPGLASSVPTDFSALTDLWEDPQGPVGASSKRLILFAPDGPGWSDISASWENVVHHPSQAGGGLSDVDYGTIIDSIGNSV